MRVIAMIAVGGALLATQPAFAANLIANGSFELPVIPGGTSQNDPNNVIIPSWTAVNADIMANNFTARPPPPSRASNTSIWSGSRRRARSRRPSRPWPARPTP